MGLLSNRIREEDLQPGDHVYSWRCAYAYAHHGIFIGNGLVIHFTRAPGEETGTGTFLDSLFSSSQLSSKLSSMPCTKCGVCLGHNGVMRTCLQCFLRGGQLYRFQYNENTLTFLGKARGGMCTLAASDAAEMVLHRSQYLLANGFGCYHIFHNNCEDFALFCKTGLLVMEKKSIGRSGQSVSLFGAPIAAVFSMPLLIVTQSWGCVIATSVMYCLSRYSADIGVRKDVIKVSVEDLIVKLGSSLQTTDRDTDVNVMNPCRAENDMRHGATLDGLQHS